VRSQRRKTPIFEKALAKKLRTLRSTRPRRRHSTPTRRATRHRPRVGGGCLRGAASDALWSIADVSDNEETLLAEVGQQLLSIRAQQGGVLEEIAAEAHIDPERLAGAEAGETKLKAHELQALADIYGVDVTAFFGGRVTPFSYLAGA
jgi:ribosome-binding protein aMBF1 (putative translation factor)